MVLKDKHLGSVSVCDQRKPAPPSPPLSFFGLLLPRVEVWARVLTQRLRALASLPEDLALVLSVHTMAHESSGTSVPGDLILSSDLHGCQAFIQCIHTYQAYTQRQNSYIQWLSSVPSLFVYEMQCEVCV